MLDVAQRKLRVETLHHHHSAAECEGTGAETKRRGVVNEVRYGDCAIRVSWEDHGDPLWPEGQVLFCSDEHITLVPRPEHAVELDQRIRLVPAHLDPTVARHETMWLVDGTEVVDEFPVDLRHW